MKDGKTTVTRVKEALGWTHHDPVLKTAKGEKKPKITGAGAQRDKKLLDAEKKSLGVK